MNILRMRFPPFRYNGVLLHYQSIRAFDLACKAGDLLFVLNEFADGLRSHLRYSTDPDWDTATVEKLYEILNRMKTEHCLHLD